MRDGRDLFILASRIVNAAIPVTWKKDSFGFAVFYGVAFENIGKCLTRTDSIPSSVAEDQ